MDRSWFVQSAAACGAGLGSATVAMYGTPLLMAPAFGLVWLVGWLVFLATQWWVGAPRLVADPLEPGGGPPGKLLVLGALVTFVGAVLLFLSWFPEGLAALAGFHLALVVLAGVALAVGEQVGRRRVGRAAR